MSSKAKKVSDLQKKYPKLLGNVYCGISAGPGWYHLLDNLCEEITKLDPSGEVKVAQIKEKFGGLRFYVDGASKEVYELIHTAEAESVSLCEACGFPGELRYGGWIRCLCDGCYEKFKAKRSDGGP